MAAEETADLQLTLAQLNLSRGDLSAALACARRALASGLTAPEAQRLVALLETLVASAERSRQRDPAREGRELLAVARRAVPAPAPAPSPSVEPPADRPSTTLDAVRALLVSPELLAKLREVVGPSERPGELTLPAVEVVERLLTLDLVVEDTARVALDLVARATGATHAFLVFARRGASFALGGATEPPPEASRGILEEVERTRATVLVHDASTDARFSGRDSVQGLALRSVLCVPATAPDGEVVAAIYLDAAGVAGRFGPAERKLAESLAAMLAPSLRNARRFDEMALDLARSRHAVEARAHRAPRLLGESPAMKALAAMIERTAPGQQTVLVQGETGSGKELVARAIHAASPRARFPFVAENMAVLSEGVLEAELFGHTKGAFTGADRSRPGLFRAANGGTLFLDEVGEMPEELQRKLLRVLQEREVRPVGGSAPVKVDVRVIAATHRDLEALVREGTFRQDLYYRLAVLRVRVPPLRERLEDLPLLLGEFVARAATERGASPPSVSPELVARLRAHDWPGNVRELETFATRLVVEGEQAELLARSEPRVEEQGVRVHVEIDEGSRLSLRDARILFDRAYVGSVLARCSGNVTTAARAIGLSRPYLSALLSRLGLREGRPPE